MVRACSQRIHLLSIFNLFSGPGASWSLPGVKYKWCLVILSWKGYLSQKYTWTQLICSNHLHQPWNSQKGKHCQEATTSPHRRMPPTLKLCFDFWTLPPQPPIKRVRAGESPKGLVNTHHLVPPLESLVSWTWRGTWECSFHSQVLMLLLV